MLKWLVDRLLHWFKRHWAWLVCLCSIMITHDQKKKQGSLGKGMNGMFTIAQRGLDWVSVYGYVHALGFFFVFFFFFFFF